MADDLSLLFKIRGDASGAKNAAAETKAALAGLRTEFSGLATQIPGLNGTLSSLTVNLTSVLRSSEGAAAGIAGVAGPAGIAAAALIALTAAGVALTQEFIDLTVATADWQGKLFDLSQQTGVSVETLNALEISASKTGGSIDQVAASLGIFQKNMEAAQDSGSKQAALLKELGVESDNTEEAFRQAVKALAEMDTGFHQTATALELFGRGGKSILAIIKETNGDIDSAVTKLGGLARVTEEQAAASDKFNDALKDIQITARGLTAELVQDSIPRIVSGLEATQRVMAENQHAIELISSAVGIFVQGNVVVLLGALHSVELAWRGVAAATNAASFGLLNYFARQSAGAGTADAGGDLSLTLPPRASGGGLTLGAGITRQRGGGGGGGGRGGGRAGISEADKRLKEVTEAWMRDVANAGVSSNKILTQSMDDMQAALDAATKKLAEDAESRIELEERIADAVKKQRDALSELQGVEKSHFQIIQELVQEKIKEAEALGGLTDEMKKQLDVLLEIGRQMDLIEEKRKRFAGVEGGAEGSSTKPVKRATSSIDQLFGAINENLSGTKRTAAIAGVEALTGAFEGLGQAVGQVVEAWVLYGNAGVSVRQVTAQILASVAQQAAVKAVFELAEGFAALALAFFGVPNAGPSAQAHFTAAAVYGGIAGVAAVAGRAVAGGSFAQGGAASGGGGGSSRGGGGSSQNPAPIVLGSQRQVVEHIVTVKAERGFLTSHLVRELDSNNPELNRVLRRERG
jgi:hypothetical protein